MASKKKGIVNIPGTGVKSGSGDTTVKTKPRLRKEKFNKLKEKLGVKSLVEIGDGVWYKTDHLNNVTSMTIPVRINSDLTRENFTSIIMQVEEAAEKLISTFPGDRPVIWTAIEAYEYAKNVVGSKPIDQPGKENELERTMNGTPGVPVEFLSQVFASRLRKYLKNGGFTYFSTVVVNIRNIKDDAPGNWKTWANKPAFKRDRIR